MTIKTDPIITPNPLNEPPKPDPIKPNEGESDPKGQPTPEELAADVEKWKAMARKHEDASKSKDDRLKKLDELEESQKTEAQKLIDRAEKAEARATEIEVRATRAEVAAAKGVPVNLITGSTKEEMESNADALVAFKGTPIKPDMGQGSRGDDIGSKKQLSQSELDAMTPEQINEARHSGRLDTLLKK